MNWRAWLLPALPYLAIIAAVVGWIASYTAQQRAIGALDVHVGIQDSTIKINGDSMKIFRADAARSDHAFDSLTAVTVAARARARASDSTSTVLTASYRELRDRALAPANSGSLVPVPTLPQLVASADAAVNACELAKDDCKKRGDLEQQRGDSARAAAIARAEEANAAETALVASQRNEKTLKAALPSTTGNVARAGLWTTIGGVAVYLVCHLAHCQ